MPDPPEEEGAEVTTTPEGAVQRNVGAVQSTVESPSADEQRMTKKRPDMRPSADPNAGEGSETPEGATIVDPDEESEPSED